MSLLRNIQDSAVDANESIGSLLRKCKILAARLGSAELKLWVECELNGYSEKNELPDYRIMSVGCKGNFSGRFGSSMQNAEIPSRCIPKDFRDNLYISYLAQPISSIESLINESDSGIVQEPWPSDVTAYFGVKIYQNYNCLEAWKVIPVNALVGILDMIRNKVLSFVLEIESEDPQAGDAPINSKPVSDEKVQQVFHTYISGNVQNFTTGSTNVKQHAIQNEKNEIFGELINLLVKAEASKDSKDLIINTIEEMRDTQGTTNYKDKYNHLMSVLSDHFQVFGSIVVPFLPALSAMLP